MGGLQYDLGAYSVNRLLHVATRFVDDESACVTFFTRIYMKVFGPFLRVHEARQPQ